MVFLTAYSRVYLGAHWPSQVLGGLLLGLLWLTVTIRVFWWGSCHLPRSLRRVRPTESDIRPETSPEQ